MQLKELKKGEFFRIITKGKQGKKTYIKGEFDRSEKKYLCTDAEDAGSEGKYFKASQEITTSFEY